MSPLPAPFVRNTQFWYDDGNVIIVAQNVGFRVYKGLLSKSSRVLGYMVNAAQLPPSQSRDQPESGDNCTVVHVTDTAAEMRSLLMVLLEGRHYMQRRLEFTFEDMANCIQLACKYEIEDLLEDSLKELRRYYPDDFDAWDSRVESAEPTHAIVAVNLARLVCPGAQSLFPSAIYACCQLDAMEMVDGHKREDGAVDSLSREDLALCINGKAELCVRAVPFIHKLFGLTNNTSCTSSDQCRKSLTSLQNLRSSRVNVSDGCDLLASWEGKIRKCGSGRRTSAERDMPLCASCITALCIRERMLRREIWLDKVWLDVSALQALDEDESEEDDAESAQDH
ncbi:hypothetical protein EVJ58_g9755 [Rhodofomes roseus]|uniref:BTB domain-containing protein n=1 Tax=Rhodofomes roseus TaxID=34475 RepID=A0A4Y9XSZ9_9APHY|nr:hypothetical protein EVJ58_g9755 [Rhodofomes roseus]